MIDVHYWPTPNGGKVTILLEKCAIDLNEFKYFKHWFTEFRERPALQRQLKRAVSKADCAGCGSMAGAGIIEILGITWSLRDD